MPKMVICSVWDSAIGSYGRPFFVPSRGVAMRSFQDEVRRKADDNPMNAHPEDFELFYLAEFDDQTGLFAEQLQQSLLRAVDVKDM